MAITNIAIYQDNKVGGSNLVPIHSPAIFIVSVTYTDTAPTSIFVQLLDSNSQILGTYRAVPLEDVSTSIRRFMFIANEIVKSLMGDFNDQFQALESFVYIPNVTKQITLKFYDPQHTEVNASTTIDFIHGASQIGEYPNKPNVFNNSADTYFALKDTFCYVYFYNDNVNNVINVVPPTPEQLKDITFNIQDESLNPIFEAQIKCLEVPVGQIPFIIYTPVDSGTVVQTDCIIGIYQFEFSADGFETQIANYSITDDTEITITLIALPADYLELVPESVIIAHNLNSTTQIAVSSNIAWTIDDGDLTLFTLDKTSGTGDDVITITAISENTGAQRSEQFHLLGGVFDVVGTIVQAAYDDYLQLSAIVVNIGSEVGDTATFDIVSNIDWNIFHANLTFAGLDIDSGNGNQTVTITVIAKNTGAARTVDINVQGGIYNIPLAITQAATSDYLTVDKTSLLLASSIGSFKQFTISTNLEWEILASGTIFAFISELTGSGNKIITCTTFLQNNTGKYRIETLTVRSVNGLFSATILLYQDYIII